MNDGLQVIRPALTERSIFLYQKGTRRFCNGLDEQRPITEFPRQRKNSAHDGICPVSLLDKQKVRKMFAEPSRDPLDKTSLSQPEAHCVPWTSVTANTYISRSLCILPGTLDEIFDLF